MSPRTTSASRGLMEGATMHDAHCIKNTDAQICSRCLLQQMNECMSNLPACLAYFIFRGSSATNLADTRHHGTDYEVTHPLFHSLLQVSTLLRGAGAQLARAYPPVEIGGQVWNKGPPPCLYAVSRRPSHALAFYLVHLPYCPTCTSAPQQAGTPASLLLAHGSGTRYASGCRV